MGTRPTPAIDKNGIAWLAGEASGDYIASLVLPEVEKRFPGTPQYGVGGPRMRAVNFHAWHDIRELSVRGYVEVLMHLPRLVQLRGELVRSISESSPRVFVGVDAPDFNLGIEQKLRRRGIPTVHFVSPAIWAWRPERIHQIRRAVDHMLLVFPFEQEIYKRAGIDATYVGHPLAGVIPMKPDTEGARRDYGLMEDSLPVVTVMPGSRIDEVKGCAPAFFGAIEKLLHRFSDMHVLIPAADEAALYKKPMVVGYLMPALTGLIMQRKGLIRCVSLPNILMGENVVPEFLQYYCRADQISWALQDALTNDAKRKELVERFTALHESLKADTPSLVAEVLESRALRRW